MTWRNIPLSLHCCKREVLAALVVPWARVIEVPTRPEDQMHGDRDGQHEGVEHKKVYCSMLSIEV